MPGRAGNQARGALFAWAFWELAGGPELSCHGIMDVRLAVTSRQIHQAEALENEARQREATSCANAGLNPHVA